MKYQIISIFILLTSVVFSSYGQIKKQTGTSPCTLDCSPTRWALNIHLSPLLSTLKSDTYSSEESKQAGIHGGLDLAYFVKNEGKLKVAVSLGLNYSLLSVKRNKKFNDSVWTVDVADTTVHLFERGNLSENQRYGSLNVPLKLNIEYNLSPRLNIYLNGGVFYSLAVSKTYSSSGLLTRKGYYPTTNCWVSDLEMPGSLFFYPTDKPVSGSGNLNMKNGTGIELGLGLKYKLNQKYTISLGTKLISGNSSISNYSADPNFTYANSSTHGLNSLMSRGGDQITPNAWGIEFGLSINLGKCNRNHTTVTEVFQLDTLHSLKKDSIIQPTILKDTASIRIDSLERQQTPIIEGKENILDIPEEIQVAFTDSLGQMMKTINNSDPKRTYTLAEINEILKKGAKIKNKLNITHLIEFDYNTDKLTPESKRCIDQLIQFMKDQPQAKVEIKGHTDNQGTAEYNKILSQKRAQAAVDYMGMNGILATRLSAASFGFEKPISTNDTPEGRQKNRRVEFEIRLE